MMLAASDAPTRAAVLTPAGSGAIATIAVHGPGAGQAVGELFRPQSGRAWPPGTVEVGQFWLGRLGDQAEGLAADTVVVAVKRVAPCSLLEIHCHGGVEVVRWLLETLAARAVQVCPWQELDVAQRDDAMGTAALTALIDAPTLRTAGILLDQYHGAMTRSLDAIRVAQQCGDVAEARRLLDQVSRHAALGRRLTTPWRVAVLGAPNVGKSSLVNAIAGYQRSIVAPTPGTTRDVVTTLIAVDGWPVELIDTAGMREAAAGVEEQGIGRARAVAQSADLCLWILDAATEPVWPEAGVGRIQLVINKIDLPAAWDLDQAGTAWRVSAQTNAGVGDLCQAMARWLVPEPPSPGAAVPFTPELIQQVEILAARVGRG
jgi:tRNA modification GTPase